METATKSRKSNAIFARTARGTSAHVRPRMSSAGSLTSEVCENDAADQHLLGRAVAPPATSYPSALQADPLAASHASALRIVRAALTIEEFSYLLGWEPARASILA